MGKYLKTMLALLYAVQLLVVFRASIVHLYRSAVDHDRGESAGVEHFLVLLKRAVTPRYDPHESLAAADRHAVIAEHADGESEDAHHEEKRVAAKRARRNLPREYLIRNLFPTIKKKRPTAAARETIPSSPGHTTLFLPA